MPTGQPVHDERAEQAVLGAILHNSNVFGSLNGIKSHHFFKPTHEYLFDTLQRMYMDGTEIDAITLFSELEKDGKLRRVGGAPYLATLLSACTTPTSAGYYANIVKEKWKLRRIGELGQRLVSLGGDDTAIEDIPAVLEQARSFLEDADLDHEAQSLAFHDLYMGWIDQQDDDRPPILTPWQQLNDKLNGGLQRQRLYVIGARPGCGKTIMGVQLAMYAAISQYNPAHSLIFSLEMSKEDLAGRMLACGAHVPYSELTSRRMSSDTMEKINRWAGASAGMNLEVDDNPDQTIEEIAQACRIHKQRKGLDLVFIDYLGLLKPSVGVSRVEQVDYFAQKARGIARQLDCVVVVAAQLNRRIEDNNGKPRLPVKSDFRESGGVEQTADVAIVLSRPPDDNGEESKVPMMNCSLVKNRTGTEGTFKLVERFDQARFQ